MNATRRGVLRASAAVGAAGLAGCLGDDKTNNVSGSGGGGTRQSKLAYLRVANEHYQEHTVHVLVQQAGEPVHWSDHTLDAGDNEMTSRTVEQTWTGADDEVTVFLRLDDATEWQSFDISEGGADCYGAMAKVDPDGEFGVWFQQRPSVCGDTTTTE